MFFRPLRDWLDQRLIQKHPIEPTLWANTLAAVPILQPLADSESLRLKELATLFLQRKRFLAVQDLALTPSQQLLIAAQACLPLLNLDFSWYADWLTVVVYPGQFLRPRREIDAIGVMHEWTEVLRGEAWQRGPVVLSWADVAGSGVGDGYNVILHEMAHQLDMLNGPADGFPPLHRSMPVSAWNRAFTEAYQQLNVTIARGNEPPIDPYAGQSPAEFFAVISEYFFERPAHLQHHYPKVYLQLAAFYRQDPLRRRVT
jgi:Mlc titration factor MtfA (ptsG expression regulator)